MRNKLIDIFSVPDQMNLDTFDYKKMLLNKYCKPISTKLRNNPTDY